jgi:hypothetical protein
MVPLTNFTSTSYFRTETSRIIWHFRCSHYKFASLFKITNCCR